MKRPLQLIVFLLFLCMAGTGQLKAQFGAWSFFQPVTATNNTDSNQVNYQIRLVVNTQTLISQNKMEADGRDIRFGDGCATANYAYWIEDYINTDTTVIWVRLDSIDTGDSLSFQMFYGNSAATAVSDFNLTFPNAIVTSGNQTLTQGTPHRWIQVNSGDTLFLDNGVLNTIEARVVNVSGVISGAGRGFQAPPTSNNGNGPGGGVWGSSSGAGAGSYGGAGGVGGYDANDPINAAGATYGTTTGPDIEMGSTGGSASTVTAGNGGGGLRLLAEVMDVTGVIDCDGGLAQQPGGGQGAGGGSGGGILLHADHLNFTGGLSADGNGGSIGTSTANDDGGGGGGGRIKLFYESSLVNTGTQSVLGGPGGQNGGAGTGAPGSAGTTNVDTLHFDVVDATLGGEQPNTGIPAPPVITAPSGPVCGGDTVVLGASGAFSSYSFTSGGSVLQTGMDSTYSFTATASGTYEITSVGLCTYVDSVSVVVASFPDPQLAATPQTICSGDSAFLIVANGFSNVVWSTGQVAQFIYVNTAGPVSVEVTDANGCSASDTIQIAMYPPLMPMITGIPAPPVCDGDTLFLSTANPWVSYSWSTGDTTRNTILTASAGLSLEVTDTNGCSEGIFANILFSQIPNPSLSVVGNTITVNPMFATYQWLLNGSPINGATTQSFNANSTGTYSVTVTNQDGCEATSDTTFLFVSLNPGATLPGVGIAPNPFSDNLKYSVQIPEAGKLSVEVVDMTGRVWKSLEEEVVTGEFSQNLNMEELPAGIYLLRLKLGEAQSVSRLLKQ